MADPRATIAEWIADDEAEIVNFVAELTRAKSPNPPGDTREVASVVGRLLDANGIAYELVGPDKDRPNVVATFEGREQGSHVVFNGRVGALTGKNAMPAKVGETVLIVHSQADRDTRPHLVGGHGDYVWETGSFQNPPQVDVETWFIRGGSAGAALYKFRQPGIVAYVNHNMIEAFELGATAHFKVEGAWNDDLMAQMKAPAPIMPRTNSP